MPDYGLGRRYKEDERDRAYPMQTALPQESAGITYRYWWTGGAWMDQGATPTCVGHAWAHWLEDGPVTQPEYDANPFSIYTQAQKIDEWPGEDYAGTSVRAGAKVLQREGLISEYRWAWTLDTIIQALLTTGPVVVGTPWHEGMSNPDADGFVVPTGSVVGGHAYLATGINTSREIIRFKNSWGRGWGKRGHFYMRLEHAEKLISHRWSEACLALEASFSS